MEKKDLFTHDYVNNLLTPFLNYNIRMSDSNKVIPFCLETSMESSFRFEITHVGIRFILKDNFYIKRDLESVFLKALNESDIATFRLDQISGIESTGVECVTFNKIVAHMVEHFTPQIAFTYFSQIKSLSVHERGFILNGVDFYICNH